MRFVVLPHGAHGTMMMLPIARYPWSHGNPWKRHRGPVSASPDAPAPSVVTAREPAATGIGLATRGSREYVRTRPRLRPPVHRLNALSLSLSFHHLTVHAYRSLPFPLIPRKRLTLRIVWFAARHRPVLPRVHPSLARTAGRDSGARARARARPPCEGDTCVSCRHIITKSNSDRRTEEGGDFGLGDNDAVPLVKARRQEQPMRNSTYLLTYVHTSVSGWKSNWMRSLFPPCPIPPLVEL